MNDQQSNVARSSTSAGSPTNESGDSICPEETANTDNSPQKQKKPQAQRSTSEFDLRAASMRSKIEQKLNDIEAQMKSQQEAYEEQEFLTRDTSELSDGIKMMDIKLRDIKRSRSCSLAEMRDSAIARLTAELDNTQKELKLKDIEVTKLSKVRDEVGAELEDLTASLFEEANNMVYEANMKRSIAEKHAKEANMKLTVLQEEVTALKSLIQAAMPFVPNYAPIGLNNSSSLSKDRLSEKSSSSNDLNNDGSISNPAVGIKKESPFEADPILHQEFVSWRQCPVVERSHPFLKRIYEEDINPCMNFGNKELSEKVLFAIEEDKIIIENISGKNPLPKTCDLLKSPRFCHYRMNLGLGRDYYISRLSRNRIAAICDFFCYLRYIVRGLITQSIHDVYYEILKKRKAIWLARLGLNDS